MGVQQRVGRAGVVGERKNQFVTPPKKALDFELLYSYGWCVSLWDPRQAVEARGNPGPTN